MSLDQITVTLTDKNGRISADALAHFIESCLEILRGLQSKLVDSDSVVQWDVVHVKMSSPLRLTLSPIVTRQGKVRKSAPKKIVSSFMQDMMRVERGKSLPKYMDDETLEAVHRMAKESKRSETPLSFSIEGKPEVKLTENTIQNIDKIAEKARHYVDFTTIEGVLKVVSCHDHNSFFIWETLTNNKVECLVSAEQFNRYMDLIGKRVAVTGRVSYRNHIPQKINVSEDIRVLRNASELPQIEDIQPIDITNGLSSEEYIRRIRNG